MNELECCDECGEPTGRAGIGEDSIADSDGCVYCSDCRPHYCKKCGGEPLPANESVCDACHWQQLTPAQRDESIRRAGGCV